MSKGGARAMLVGVLGLGLSLLPGASSQAIEFDKLDSFSSYAVVRDEALVDLHPDPVAELRPFSLESEALAGHVGPAVLSTFSAGARPQAEDLALRLGRHRHGGFLGGRDGGEGWRLPCEDRCGGAHALPEPGTVVLTALGSMVLWWVVRRRRRGAARMPARA